LSGNLVNAIDVPRLELKNFPRALSSQAFGASSRWVQNVVNPFRPCVFVDTDGIGTSDSNIGQENSCDFVSLERMASRQAGGNMVNDTEAAIVTRMVEALTRVGVPPSSIGIICPFNAQIRLMETFPEMKQFKSDGLEISTIDKFQGRDKLITIVSFVRSNSKGKVGRLLEDKRRVNVAITRSKRKLILLGSFSTIRRGSATLKDILDQLQKVKRIERLPRNAVSA